MTADIRWRLSYAEVGEQQLCGFREGKAGRSHALKHFLAPRERWAELGGEPSPDYFQDQLIMLQVARGASYSQISTNPSVINLLNQASRRYVEATRDVTIGTHIQKASFTRRVLPEKPSIRIRCLNVASFAGVYAIFMQSELSHLVTAYRPLPGVVRGRPHRMDYARAALRELSKDLARTNFESVSTSIREIHMDEHIKILLTLLEEALNGPLQDQSSFINLAVTGEQLRRARIEDDELREGVKARLTRYDEILSKYQGEVPEGLEIDLQQTLDELAEAAGNSATEDDDLQWEERLLIRVEEVLDVAVAAVRAGKLPTANLELLAQTTRTKIEAITPHLARLWDFAETRELAFRPDPDFPLLFSWWDCLAQLSPSRMSMELAVGMIPAAKREAMIETAVKKLAQEGWFKQLQTKLKEISNLRFELPRPLVAEAFATQSSILSKRTLILETEELSLIQVERTLEIWVAEDHYLEVKQARLSDGPALTQEQIEPWMVQVNLPPEVKEGTLTLSIQIDGTEVILPTISMEELT